MVDPARAPGFLRHIQACNRHDLSGYRSFSIAGVTVGQVRVSFMERLLALGLPFMPDAGGICLHPGLTDAASRTRAVAAALDRLVADGAIPKLRREMYAVADGWGRPTLMELDRAAIPFFGVTAYGLHVNGFVRQPDGLHLWVGKRAMDRGVAPGQYDNLVAGGQPAGLSLADNLVKEAWEEAGLPADMALRAVPVGAITYLMEQDKGLKPDVLFLYDLELPPDFVPHNTDGEVERFELWPIARVAESVRDSDDWKFNVNLTVIDFLIRHGWLTPEHPEYLDLCRGLRK
jgi:8-oxo-dGTP pyrophosphatase MutT (NUDIX family)